ncbi:MAG: hypothetical protein Q4Q07_05930 [Tissierellia bacterium]|nr:hypothetical protein [Tissierellia bacterium]
MESFKYTPLEDRLKYYILSAIIQCGIFIYGIHMIKQGKPFAFSFNTLIVILAILTRQMLRQGNLLWKKDEKHSKWLNMVTKGVLVLSLGMIYGNHVFVRLVSNIYFDKVGEPFTQINGYIRLFGSMIVGMTIMASGLLEIGYLWRIKEEREGIEPSDEG